MKLAAIDHAMSATVRLDTPAATLNDQIIDQATQITRLLREFVRSEAIALVAMDPISRTHGSLAHDGYTDRTMAYVLNGFPAACPAYAIAREKDTHSLRWRDYRRDWNLHLPDTFTAQEYLMPDGFSEGSTMCLRVADGRYVGAIHMSWSREAHATDERREMTERFRPILLNICDQLRAPQLLADELAPGSYALAVSPNGFAFHLPNRSPGPHLGEGGELRRLVLEKAKSSKPQRFIWPDGAGRCHQVTITPCRGNILLITEECIRWPYNLSLREIQILHLVTSGASNPNIAEQLFVSPRTVSTHIEHILAKMSCDSRTRLAALAVSEGLLLAENPSRRSRKLGGD
ncbi:MULTISPECIES: LuxR C-terminal-related transcriptional regulator [Bradyrhizobium]|uniref:Response regulator transcription factor n=1 Tax=Bradyrhizobium elkanii TaxID=29448 RepID=A0A4U6RYW0_BRAEL|nr:LuxR C-terminal-related transcriptional regulator [Bradyrhizobium elkanii]MTV16746.1 response regulator transcription factor [Bradyrhizobium sp. BR2003]TKV80437.1 response regulator transcription factor [Bradyrhizobium elkanii]